MDEWMCIEAARKALARYDKPKMIHTDRGRQFMGKGFTVLFENAGVSISRRPHQSLGYRTPDEVYYGKVYKGAAA